MNDNFQPIEVFSFTTDRIEFKSEDGNDFIIGYVSTSDRDIVDDVVTKSCLMDMLDQLKSGRLKLDLEHETLRGKDDFDQKLNITKVPLAVSVDGAYTDTGLMVKYRMNEHYKKLDSKGDVVYTYEEVKDMVKEGSLDSFSIAFITERETEKKADDGVKERLLDKIRWINTALTGNPINDKAGMINVMLKSLDRDNAHQKGSTESSMMKNKKSEGGFMDENKKDVEVKNTEPEKKEEEEPKTEPEPKPEPEAPAEAKDTDAKNEELGTQMSELKGIVDKQTKALDEATAEIKELKAQLEKPVHTHKVEDAGAKKAEAEAKSLKEKDVVNFI